jgi:hypothetical protein
VVWPVTSPGLGGDTGVGGLLHHVLGGNGSTNKQVCQEIDGLFLPRPAFTVVLQRGQCLIGALGDGGGLVHDAGGGDLLSIDNDQATFGRAIDMFDFRLLQQYRSHRAV